MKVGVVLVGLISIILPVSAVVWMQRGEWHPLKPKGQGPVAQELVEVSPTGPWPKAVFDRKEFNFGRMEVGDKGTHDFTVRNEGDAPLILRQGQTTCQCTISEVENNRIEQGQSATIKLTWLPADQSEVFEIELRRRTIRIGVVRVDAAKVSAGQYREAVADMEGGGLAVG